MRTLHRILRDEEGNSSLIERFDELSKLLCCRVHAGRCAGVHDPFLPRPGAAPGEVAARVRETFHQLVSSRRQLFPERHAALRLKDETIARLAGALGATRGHDDGADMEGLLYEEVIRNTFDKSDNQQFFTPRPIVQFLVSLVGAALGGTICDPACGTGGFLLAVDALLARGGQQGDGRLLGIEIDERLAWTAGINLHLHEAGPFEIQHLPGAGALGGAVRDLRGKVDAVVTNPPFGSELSDPEALSELRLGQGRATRRRGVLFIERCLDLLRPGGVAGIVIDDSVLNGSASRDARQLILEEADPCAVVSLPETAFKPYASVKTSILILQKKGGAQPRLRRGGLVFFAAADEVGRKPSGDPLVRFDAETGGQRVVSDLPRILTRWASGPPEAPGEAPGDDRRSFWSPLPAAAPSFADDGRRLDPAYHHPARHEAARALEGAPHPLLSLSEICHLRRETTVPAREIPDAEITYVGLANISVHTGVCRPAVVRGASLKSAVRRFRESDLLFSRMRPALRKICLTPENVREGYASAECLVLTPRLAADTDGPIFDRELLALLLRSDMVYGQIVHLITGIGRPRLSQGAVMKIRLPVPPPREQRRLVQDHRRAEASSRGLVAQSDAALGQSRQILQDAGQRLTADLLSPGPR